MVAVVVAWCSVVTVWTKVFCPWCSSHSHSAVDIPHDIEIILFLAGVDGVREFFEEGILHLSRSHYMVHSLGCSG